MKASELQQGKTYRCRVNGNYTNVKLLEVSKVSGFNNRLRTRYRCLNLKTNREVMIKSALKFTRETGPVEAAISRPEGLTLSIKMPGPSTAGAVVTEAPRLAKKDPDFRRAALKRQFGEKVLERVVEYIQEAEAQEGLAYWDQFEDVDNVLEDFGQFLEALLRTDGPPLTDEAVATAAQDMARARKAKLQGNPTN